MNSLMNSLLNSLVNSLINLLMNFLINAFINLSLDADLFHCIADWMVALVKFLITIAARMIVLLMSEIMKLGLYYQN